MDTRVIVCGGVDFSDRDLCFTQLEKLLSQYENVEIVSGHARGADSLGEEYAREHQLSLKEFPAEWKKYGRAAGPIRNREMLKYAMEAKPVIIAFWDGESRGTKNMINQGEKAGAEVHIVRYYCVFPR